MQLPISRIFLSIFLLSLAVIAFPKPVLANAPVICIHLTNAVTGTGVNGITFTQTDKNGASRSVTTNFSNCGGPYYNGLGYLPGGDLGGQFGCLENPQTFTASQPSVGTVSPASQQLNVNNDTGYDVFFTYNPPTGNIWASPQPVPDGAGLGTTYISWNTANTPTAEVWVTDNGGPESGPFSSDNLSYSNAIASWIQTNHYYEFRLYTGGRAQWLSSVAVTRPQGSGSLSTSPNPVPYSASTGTVNITYSLSGTSYGQVYRSIDGGGEVLNTGGGGGTFADPSIQFGHTYVYRLYDGDQHSILLSSVTVTMSPAPTCNSGAVCGACSAPSNTCSTNNGSQTCTYTTYTGGGACNQTSFSQSCTLNNCSSGYSCISNSCVVNATPWLQTTNGDIHSSTQISLPGGP